MSTQYIDKEVRITDNILFGPSKKKKYTKVSKNGDGLNDKKWHRSNATSNDEHTDVNIQDLILQQWWHRWLSVNTEWKMQWKTASKILMTKTLCPTTPSQRDSPCPFFFCKHWSVPNNSTQIMAIAESALCICSAHRHNPLAGQRKKLTQHRPPTRDRGNGFTS